MKYEVVDRINKQGIMSFDVVQANDEVVMYSIKSISAIAEYYIGKAIQAGKQKNLLVQFKIEPVKCPISGIEKITARFLPHTTAQPEPAPQTVFPVYSTNPY